MFDTPQQRTLIPNEIETSYGIDTVQPYQIINYSETKGKQPTDKQGQQPTKTNYRNNSK